MRTTLHYYRYNTETQAAEYAALCTKLRDMGLRKFGSISAGHAQWYRESIAPLDGRKVELETAFVFDDQWNTAPPAKLCVFDWAEAIYPNKKIKEGMWLEQTDEMRKIRATQHACGYCGARYDGKPSEFCPKCIGSEYLTENKIHLRRPAPAGVALSYTRAELTKEENAVELTKEENAVELPAYLAAQGLGELDREQQAASKRRRDVARLIPAAQARAAQIVAEAQTKTEAYTWLLDNGMNILDNTIYYSHTRRFCFGWRTPLTADEKSRLLEVVSEFPFEYDIK
jgi:hypothetical protein